MKNGDLPIKPLRGYEGVLYHESDQQVINNAKLLIGLTKREQFAAMALQGMLSNGEMVDIMSEPCAKTCASFAIQCADALLYELDKPNQNGQ